MATDDEKKRRNSLLTTILFEGGNSAARPLRDELEEVHGVVATLDQVRADLRWLESLGAVKLQGDVVALTQAGNDHVQRRLELF